VREPELEGLVLRTRRQRGGKRDGEASRWYQAERKLQLT
jgi:hypothetical protein